MTQHPLSPRYSLQQNRGSRRSRREEAAAEAAAALPVRRTGAEIRPRLSLEYHKAPGSRVGSCLGFWVEYIKHDRMVGCGWLMIGKQWAFSWRFWCGGL